MTVFLLTWNPDNWQDPEHWVDEAIAATAAGATFKSNWSTGQRTSEIEPGDLGFIVRQRQDRGIVAFVTFDSEVYQSAHWSGVPGKLANFAETVILDWVDPGDRLTVEALKSDVPEVTWDRLQGSGVKVSEDTGERLIEMWIAHMEELGRGRPMIPEELDPYIETYSEGTVARVLVNRYERDSRARAACLQHYGAICAVCGFDFGQRYGEIGEGFIHVHHLIEISALPSGYRVDPIEDLRPVCPNCHAMLHQQRPAMEIGELQGRLK